MLLTEIINTVVVRFYYRVAWPKLCHPFLFEGGGLLITSGPPFCYCNFPFYVERYLVKEL